jgi:hypothetical protein
MAYPSFNDGSVFHCRRCAKPKELWHADGFRDGERLYCCESCATGFSCLCHAHREAAESARSGAYTGPERRVSPLRRAWKQERRAVFLKPWIN